MSMLFFKISIITLPHFPKRATLHDEYSDSRIKWHHIITFHLADFLYRNGRFFTNKEPLHLELLIRWILKDGIYSRPEKSIKLIMCFENLEESLNFVIFTKHFEEIRWRLEKDFRSIISHSINKRAFIQCLVAYCVFGGWMNAEFSACKWVKIYWYFENFHVGLWKADTTALNSWPTANRLLMLNEFTCTYFPHISLNVQEQAVKNICF